jgi:hypothetical protein
MKENYLHLSNVHCLGCSMTKFLTIDLYLTKQALYVVNAIWERQKGKAIPVTGLEGL